MKCKCDISKCKASCCHNVPMPKAYFSAYRKRVVTQWISLYETGMRDNKGNMLYVPLVDRDQKKNKCPFLRDDLKCNIYENRPWICRQFGTPDTGSEYLKCGWLNGKECDNNFDETNRRECFLDMVNDFLNGKI